MILKQPLRMMIFDRLPEGHHSWPLKPKSKYAVTYALYIAVSELEKMAETRLDGHITQARAISVLTEIESTVKSEK